MIRTSQLRRMVAAACTTILVPMVTGDVIYVNDDAPGLVNGTSWDDAYLDLQDALGAASTGDQIWIAAGTYRPAPAGGSRDSSFTLVDGVDMYGGFEGTEDTLDERAGLFVDTVLSGDLNGDDQPGFVNNDENSFHVVTALGNDIDVLVDGVTVTGGNAGAPSDFSGGGMCLTSGGSVHIANWHRARQHRRRS